MTNTTLDGSSTPVVIAAGSIEQVNDGDTLFLLGAIDNLGTIFADTTGAPTTLDAVGIVVASPVVTLEGGGTLLLGSAFGVSVYGSSATPETLVNVDNTIIASGDIGPPTSYTIEAGETAYPITITNEALGVIDANGTVVQGGSIGGPGLFLATGTLAFVNDGLVEATANGGLAFDSATIDQSGGGTILASGAGVIVGSEYYGSTGGVDIVGGTLDASGGGEIALNDATLDGSAAPLTIGSGVDLPDQSISDLLGTIDNLGTIDMTGAGFAGGNIFLASPTVTLGGNGEVLDPTLSGPDGNPVALVNVANTISGFGQVGIATIDNSMFGTLGASAPVAVTNEAAGVIDATGTAGNEGGGGLVIGDAIYLYGGGAPLINDGLIEATGIGGLNISGSTLDQSGGGTLLASGAGVAVYMQDVDLIGGSIESSDGGTIEFNGGTNTLTSGPGPFVISSGAVLEVTGFVTDGTLTLQASTIDNLGTLIDDTSMILAEPTMTLEGGGLVQLSGSVGASGTVTLVNTDNDITGGDIAGATLAITNAAAGVLNGTEIDIGRTLTNAGLLENVSVGLNAATTVDNIGTGNLLAGDGGDVGLYAADIIGGTLAATGTSEFLVGGGNAVGGATLDGRGSPVTIAAGTTLQDFFNEISLPFTIEVSGGLALVGTIDFAGTIVGAIPSGLSGPVAIPNAGLLVGTGEVAGSMINTGTLLAQGGTLTVTGDVDGSGGIVIAPGAAFVLGGESGETVDFQNAQNDRLVLNTPTAFTGTLANMTYGDVIDLGTADIQSAKVVGGSTLAVTLIDSSTIDYTLSGLHAGTSFVPRSTSTPTETFNFTYVGGATTNEPDYSATGTGSLTVITGGSTASLADVTAFNLELQVTTTGTAFPGPGTDPITYDLASLTSFTASFGINDTLTALSLGTARGGDLTVGLGHVDGGDFEVTGLGVGGASTDDSLEGGVLTQGSIDVTPLGPVFSEIVVACFAEGTRIRTPDGERPVETLRAGDVVMTAAGSSKKVIWVGHRRINCSRHPRPHDVQPVRIFPNAFGPDAPHADLLLSPDHAVLVHDVLIPVRYLVNGATIRREDHAEITYWHVELAAHDALLAENLPCESYLDTGNRGAFVENYWIRPARATGLGSAASR